MLDINIMTAEFTTNYCVLNATRAQHIDLSISTHFDAK
jgi:hypothetical protein